MKHPKAPTQQACPCGLPQVYARCCGRYHKGKLAAPTAEALMRSRYSAFVLGDARYLYRSWDKNTRPTLAELRQAPTREFTQLNVISTHAGQADDDSGEVEFIAHYTSDTSNTAGSNTSQHHENSLFRKQNQRWVYVKALSLNE